MFHSAFSNDIFSELENLHQQVQRAFNSVKYQLGNVKLFHTDRDSEFKNVGIDEIIKWIQN